jgi:ribA/ribD-fused uncharacterized protein
MKEEFDWKASKISLDKSKLTSSELEGLLDELPKKFIEKNRALLGESHFVKDKKGIFFRDDFEKQFNLTGSFKVSSLDDLGEAESFFKQREGRFFTKTSDSASEYLSRGPRYICAVDPNLSVRQKLQIFSEDVADGLSFLKTHDLPKTEQFKTIAPILDYVKNAAVTLLNAYIHSEKNGAYNLGDTHYQEHKIKLIELVRKVSFAYYLSLVDSLSRERLEYLLDAGMIEILEEACEKIKKEFEKHTFPNDALMRPEASHPLSILGAVSIISSTHPEMETVVGIPSGSSEVACVLAEAHEDSLKTPCSVVLLPISNHTRKLLNKTDDQKPDLTEFVESQKDKLTGKNVIIIDDNASTGHTIEEARDSIVQVAKPYTIFATVLEADIVRSQIDRSSQKRQNVAHPMLYDLSVSVLPVSRFIHPKQDLKQIMEIKQLVKFYRDKIAEAKSESEKIKYEIFIDDLDNPTERVLEELAPEQMIEKFQGTFLSNFYAVPVVLNGVTYPSVEHAYQSAKFSPSVFSSLTKEQKDGLAEILKEKGYAEKVEDFSTIFSNPTVTSGITKSIANALRNWGFVRADWDDVRIEVMINLLIQKFSIPEFREKLRDTTDLYLIEGNTWEDTLWGACEGKGKNLLGRALMNLRSKIQK